MSILVLLVLIFVIFAVFPRTGAYNANWGYGPSGGLGLLVVVLLLLYFTGHLGRLR